MDIWPSTKSFFWIVMFSWHTMAALLQNSWCQCGGDEVVIFGYYTNTVFCWVPKDSWIFTGTVGLPWVSWSQFSAVILCYPLHQNRFVLLFNRLSLWVRLVVILEDWQEKSSNCLPVQRPLITWKRLGVSSIILLYFRYILRTKAFPILVDCTSLVSSYTCNPIPVT